MSLPFSQIPSELILAEGVTLTALRTWHVIYVQTLSRPGWDLSYGQIAKEVGVSRRATIIDAVAWLVEHGWVIKMGQGQDRPNIFRICREPFVGWGDAPGYAAADPGGTPDRTSTGTPDRTHQETTPRKTPLPPASRRDVGEQIALDGVLTAVGSPPDRFAEFYALYPRKEDRRAAQRAWQAAMRRGADPAMIVEAVRAQGPTLLALHKEGLTAIDRRSKCKLPATWLNAESYLNEVRPTRPARAFPGAL